MTKRTYTETEKLGTMLLALREGIQPTQHGPRLGVGPASPALCAGASVGAGAQMAQKPPGDGFPIGVSVYTTRVLTDRRGALRKPL